MNRTYSVILITLLALALIVGGYFIYDSISWKRSDPLKAIPGDAAIIIRLNDAPAMLDKLSTNQIWAGLKTIPLPGNEPTEAFFERSLNDATLRKWLDQSPLYLSLHADSTFLLSAGVPDAGMARSLRAALGKSGEKIPFVPWSPGIVTDSSFMVHIEKGILLISSDPGMIARAVDRLGSGVSFTDDPGFQQLISFSGNRVDANVHFQYPLLRQLLSGTDLLSYFPYPAEAGPVATWSSLDLIVKNEEFLLTGYTLAKDRQMLAVINKQDPVDMTVENVLPYLTRRICWTGFTEPAAYFDSLFSGKEKELLLKRLVPWAGSEMALATVSDPGMDGGWSDFLLVSIRPGAVPSDHLPVKSKSLYKGYSFYMTMDGSDPSHMVCPGDWKSWTVIDKFVIWGKSENDMRRVVDTYEAGKTLDVNENFADFSDNIGDDGNLFYYINLHTSMGDLLQALPGQVANAIEGHREIFGNFHGFSVQYSMTGGLALTNAVITYNDKYREEDLARWKVQLDAPLAGKPYLVYDHRSKKNKIVAFDQQSNMYLIDDYGNILWKLQLAGIPVSNVYEVDYYRNGKIQYLFNTSDYVYLVDLMGRKVDNYPIKLNKSASSGLALFDYENDRDYRLIIPSVDKKIYNYDLKGNRIKGWNELKLDALVSTPPQHLVVDRKDYILISDTEGNVRVTDRRGKDRIVLKKDFIKSPNSEFYVNRTNSKGIILTTDNTGKLTYIEKRGEIETTSFGDFGPEHYFIYSDFDRNGHNDFIFLDKNELFVYDRFKDLIFTYKFDAPVTSAPEIIQAGRGEKLLGVVSKSQKKVFLFNSKGEVMVSSGLVGETPFTVGSLGDNAELNLLVGSGNILYNYPLN